MWWSSDQRLSAIVAAALHGEVRTGDSTLCERLSGGCPYVVHVVPISQRDATVKWCLTDDVPAALVIIVESGTIPEPPAELLVRIFGLTDAEASVALGVLSGGGLAAIADDLRISTATVKTHLQRVFGTTGTHRQAELVRLLLTVAP